MGGCYNLLFSSRVRWKWQYKAFLFYCFFRRQLPRGEIFTDQGFVFDFLFLSDSVLSISFPTSKRYRALNTSPFLSSVPHWDLISCPPTLRALHSSLKEHKFQDLQEESRDSQGFGWLCSLFKRKIAAVPQRSLVFFNNLQLVEFLPLFVDEIEYFLSLFSGFSVFCCSDNNEGQSSKLFET